MTARRPGVTLLAVVTVLAVAVGLLAATVPPGSAKARPKHVRSAATSSGAFTQHLRLHWSGTGHRRVRQSAVVPGIGRLQAVCKPNDTEIALTPNTRDAETQMWMATYEHKAHGVSVAVKTARVYRWATASDDGTGGTGRQTREGLNQSTPVENASSGWMHGVISQRPGRNLAAATAGRPPVTTFDLTWDWGGFRHQRRQQYCDVSIQLQTVLGSSAGVDWHGDADAAHGTAQQTGLPRAGTLSLTCQPGAYGDRSVSLALPAGVNPAKAWVYEEEITGEGDEDDHVETTSLVADPSTRTIGPLDLPQNGMLRLYYTVNGVETDVLVSSYWVVNNAAHPELDLCEVAAGTFQG
jgi:hypothetical protein